jgi:hypothetical protein
MLLRRCTFLLLLCFILYLPLHAQEIVEGEPVYELKMKNSYFSGGSIGLQFGTITMIDLSPQIGYYPLEHISVGAGFTYQYISDRRDRQRVDVNVYGGRLFSRLYLPIFDNLYAHLEYEYMTYSFDWDNNGKKEWVSVHNYFAGAGYRQRFGGRSSVNLMLLWNFNESKYALSSNPVIRVGVDIGL